MLPILPSPVLKIPLRTIVVAFKINIVKLLILNHKISGVIVNIGIGRIEQPAHFLNLLKKSLLHPVF